MLHPGEVARLARAIAVGALAPLFLFSPGQAAAGDTATCRTAYGKTACGYSCAEGYGEVRCARTPAGVCRAEYGKVTCWDPPPRERRTRSRQRGREPGRAPPHAPSTARAECTSAYGSTACGFGCTAAYGQIACAQTPQGVCHAAYGQVVCWDPPAWARRRAAAEAPRCLDAYGQIACGYGCASGYGQVRCAQTPGGSCWAAVGQIACYEPEG